MDKPIQDWTVNELQDELDKILGDVTPEQAAEWTETFKALVDACEKDVAKTESATSNFRIEGELESTAKGALEEFFRLRMRRELQGKKNKLLLAKRALKFIKEHAIDEEG